MMEELLKDAAARMEKTIEVIAREWHAKFAPSWAPSHADKILRRFELWWAMLLRTGRSLGDREFASRGGWLEMKWRRSVPRTYAEIAGRTMLASVVVERTACRRRSVCSRPPTKLRRRCRPDIGSFATGPIRAASTCSTRPRLSR